jgi:hypothetical protein
MKIPKELLCFVFRFLSPDELTIVRLVNKDFYETIDDPRFHRSLAPSLAPNWCRFRLWFRKYMYRQELITLGVDISALISGGELSLFGTLDLLQHLMAAYPPEVFLRIVKLLIVGIDLVSIVVRTHEPKKPKTSKPVGLNLTKQFWKIVHSQCRLASPELTVKLCEEYYDGSPYLAKYYD